MMTDDRLADLAGKAREWYGEQKPIPIRKPANNNKLFLAVVCGLLLLCALAWCGFNALSMAYDMQRRALPPYVEGGDQ